MFLYQVLLYSGAINGFILSLVLTKKELSGNREDRNLLANNHFWVGILIFTFSIDLLLMPGIIIEKKLIQIVLFNICQFLMAPLIYCFLLSIHYLKKPRFFYLHFLPAILVLVFVLLFERDYIINGMDSNYFLLVNGWIYSLWLSQVLIYLILFSRLIKNPINKFSNRLELNFNKKIYYYLCLFIFLIICHDATNIIGLDKETVCLFLNFCIIFSFYYTMYYYLVKEKEFAQKIPVKTSNYLKYRLYHLFVIERIYLDKQLSEQSLAKSLNVNSRYLSVYLNEYMEKTFISLLSEHRVEHAKKLIKKLPEHTLNHIAFLSGFNNKVSFINTFKKIEGLRPGEYRKKIANL